MITGGNVPYYGFGGIPAGIYSAFFFAIATFLYAYCVPVTLRGTTVACVYPHWLATSVATAAGVLLLGLAVYLVGARSADELPATGFVASEASPPGPSLAADGAPARRPAKCQYCGASSPTGARNGRRCGRPLALSNVP